MIMNEREIHPYLNEGKIEGAKRLILGSFPVYPCTDPDSHEKENQRQRDRTVRFFYGSYRSRFWGLYHKYIDAKVTIPLDKKIAIKSLEQNKIAVSDIIKSCYRKGNSASDSGLVNIEYNTLMIQEMINSGVTKILCTSKGVMENLHHRILLKHSDLQIDESRTKQFEIELITKLSGSLKKLKKPFCRVYALNGKSIYVLAIPSPGSPYRQIHNFGWNLGSKVNYVESYFEFAFTWLKND
jgi:hypothetical protein